MGTEMRCDRCKHWAKGDISDWEDEGAEVHTCRAIVERWEVEDEASEYLHKFDQYGEWMLARREAVRKAKAVVVGSSYHAELLTTADFFCAKFEEK